MNDEQKQAREEKFIMRQPSCMRGFTINFYRKVHDASIVLLRNNGYARVVRSLDESFPYEDYVVKNKKGTEFCVSRTDMKTIGIPEHYWDLTL